MVRAELTAWQEDDADDVRFTARRRAQRPRWLTPVYPKSRRRRSVPLGINGRGTGRSTVNSLARGKIRAAPCGVARLPD